MDQNKTIKQIADELGVSKTAIRNLMGEDFRAKYVQTDRKGVLTISPDGCKLISESFRKVPQTTANQFPESTANQVSGDMTALLQTTIQALREQLEVKDKQLAEKDRQIADLTATVRAQADSLQAAQALHAGTMQQMLPEAAPDGSVVEVVAAPIQEAPAEPAPEDPEPPEKLSFWQRFIGLVGCYDMITARNERREGE